MAQLSLLNSSLSFHDVNFTVIDQNNQVWLKSTEIGKALGYEKHNAIAQIYNRNKDEFTENMTQVIEIVDSLNLRLPKNIQNLNKKVRIFSLRGCHLIAMLADTPKAKEFRKWVLDILENKIEVPALVSAKSLPPAKPKLPTLMFDYTPEPWEKQFAEKFIAEYGYKEYAYNAYMLSCKACDIFNDFEQKIKQLMKDYERISKPVYKEMFGKVINGNYDALHNTSGRDRHNEYTNFTSTMWQTIDSTYSKLMYSRSDDLRNEVDHMIQTLRHTAKVLDM